MRRLAVLLAIVVSLVVAGPWAPDAQDKPRHGGVLNWFVYGDPGRLDIHLESPLSVQQAIAGIH